MGRKFDTLGCLTKIFVKQYMICMITHICRNIEAVENIPQPEIIPLDNILDDLSQLYVEQEEHDAEQV